MFSNLCTINASIHVSFSGYMLFYRAWGEFWGIFLLTDSEKQTVCIDWLFDPETQPFCAHKQNTPMERYVIKIT